MKCQGNRLLSWEIDRALGSQEETLESAGCTGQCPNYPGAPKTEDGFADCSKCPENIDNE